jgi:predicted dehydrogenase
MITTPIGMAVVGDGHWSPNMVRAIAQRPEFRLASMYGLDGARAAEFARAHPECAVKQDLAAVLLDPAVQAVSIATSPRAHYEMAWRALQAGKHVIVERPLARAAVDVEELIELATLRGRVLMPGHEFMYSPAVNKVRELIRSGALGEIYFITAAHMNVGETRPDGVIDNLAPHELSILLYWLERPITHIAVTGQSLSDDGVPETAFLTVTFSSDTTANIQISWLAQRKVHQMVVMGSKRMVEYEGTSAEEPVRIYDRRLDVPTRTPETFAEYQRTRRSGDIVVPHIEAAEPLALQLADFARAIRTGAEPRANSALGLEVVRAVEAAHHSVELSGDPVELVHDGCPTYGVQSVSARRLS